MEYELKEAGPSRKGLTLKFTAEDINAALDKGYAEINNYVKLKGFRKGKAPRRVLENKFANDASASARQVLLDEHVRKIATDEKLEVLGGFNLQDPSKIPVKDMAFSMDLEFDVMPTFDLPEYRGLEIEERGIDVPEAKIDEAIARYSRMFANYQDIEGPAAKDDILKVDFDAKVDGETIMTMQEQRLRVDGDILFGLPCPELVDKFTGAKAGDFVTLKITLPADHTNPELRGREADVEVTVRGVERGEIPEINDAFAEGLGMGSLADFRERIKANLTREAVMEARQKEEDDIINALLEKVDFPYPEAMVKAETGAMVENHRQQLLRAGVQPGAAFEAQTEKYRPEAEKEARRKVRWSILSSRIAEKEELKVTNEDMAQQIDALAQTYRTTPAKILQRIREMDGVEPMMAEILSIKVIQLVHDSLKSGGVKLPVADTESANAAAVASINSILGEGETAEAGQE